MKITEKLMELGFELKENYYGNEAYVYRTSREDNNRFLHDFVYYEDENQFYINRYFLRGLETISEAKLLQDHNDLNTPAKDKWLGIKDQLKDYKFNVYGGEL